MHLFVFCFHFVFTPATACVHSEVRKADVSCDDMRTLMMKRNTCGSWSELKTRRRAKPQRYHQLRRRAGTNISNNLEPLVRRFAARLASKGANQKKKKPFTHTRLGDTRRKGHWISSCLKAVGRSRRHAVYVFSLLALYPKQWHGRRRTRCGHWQMVSRGAPLSLDAANSMTSGPDGLLINAHPSKRTTILKKSINIITFTALAHCFMMSGDVN